MIITAKLFKIRHFTLSTEANSTKHTEVNLTKPTTQLDQAAWKGHSSSAREEVSLEVGESSFATDYY